MIPTSLNPNSSNSVASSASSTQHTAVIAGATVGVALFLLITLALVLLSRRHNARLRGFFDGVVAERRKHQSRAQVFSGEDFDDAPTTAYRDAPLATPWDASQDIAMRTATRSPPTSVGDASSLARLLRSHSSDTGSLFREDVWPPPGGARLVDPFVANASSIDLSSIVDDVMGPTQADAERHAADGGGVHSRNGSDGEQYGPVHARDLSAGSHMGLLVAAGLGSGSGSPAAVAQPKPLSPLAREGSTWSEGSARNSLE